jgi:hypothetical protein
MAIAIKQSKLNFPVMIPTSLADLKAAQRDAQRSQREVIKKEKELRNVYHQDRFKALQLANPIRQIQMLLRKCFTALKHLKRCFERSRLLDQLYPAGYHQSRFLWIQHTTQKTPRPYLSPSLIRSKLNITYSSGIRYILVRHATHLWQRRRYQNSWVLLGGTCSVADWLLQGTVAVEITTDDLFGQAILVQCK